MIQNLKVRLSLVLARLRPFGKFIFWLFPLFLILGFYLLILRDLPSPTRLKTDEFAQTTKIFDREGKPLYQIYTDQNRTSVKLDMVPLYLRQATVAIEDKDFYKHQGVNPLGGILRAIKETVLRQKLQGGSTLTQQLIKSALLTPERTVQRKIKEMILAFWTERLYNKNQILEMYLNQVPYGGIAWGVEAAAQSYFGKDVWELDLAECALLAGLPVAPTLYSPFGAHPEFSKMRQTEVLRRMIEDGYIKPEEAEAAKNKPLSFAPQKTDIAAPHFVMYVKEQLVQKYGERMIERGGLKVTTTLDLSIQKFAEEAVASEVAKLKDLRVSNGAALVTRPPTGEILAMVGSRDYFATDSGNFNVTISLRQPGSAIKPLNYALGLESKKITPASLFLDIPTCFAVTGQPLYCPINYDGTYHGPVQMRFALGNSYNIPAVKMLALNGLSDFIATASALGISSFTDPSRYGLSLTLGGGEVTMTDMTRAFGVFANTGIRQDLVSILKIEDKDGKILEEFKDDNFHKEVQKPLPPPSSILINGKRVISQDTAYLISHILLDNNARSAAFGSSSFLVIPKHPAVSVKTGTTDDKRDNWTIGFTPNFLVAAWVGNNDNTPMHPYLTSGITGAAPIFNKIMTFVLSDQADLWPKQPAGIVGAVICSLSGKLPASPSQDGPPNQEGEDKGCSTRFEYFINGTIPAERENLKQPILIDKTTDKPAPPNQTENVEMKEKQVLKDPFSIYCLDCPHDGNRSTIVTQ